MIRFYELIGKTCPNFNGLFYRYYDIEMAQELFNKGCRLIMCTDTLLTGLQSLGFDAFCMISLNLWPEQVKETYDLMCNLKLREARELHTKLCDCIKETCDNRLTYWDWVGSFKEKFSKIVGFNLGGLRKPRTTWWFNKN